MPELLGLCRYHKEVLQRFVTCKLPQSLGNTSYLGDNVPLRIPSCCLGDGAGLWLREMKLGAHRVPDLLHQFALGL